MALEFFASPMLFNVQFGLMGYFKMPHANFCRWRNQAAEKKIFWHAPDTEFMSSPPVIQQFRTIERFLIEKMLFVGKKRQLSGSIPWRGKLESNIPTEFRCRTGTGQEHPLEIIWNVSLSYYQENDGLILFLHANIPEISLDHLILLRNLKWQQSPNLASWSISVKNSAKQFGLYQSFIHNILAESGHSCPTGQSDQSAPLFSFTALDQIGPAKDVMPYPLFDDKKRLTEQEHWGLLSGDEGYRFVQIEKENRYISLQDKKMQFCGRDYFSYHFSPTNCIGFFSERMAATKKAWADWYRENIADIPTLDGYIRLSPEVPCLADGIPILVELCLLRYVELTNVEQELRAASTQNPWSPIWTRLRLGKTRLEKSLTRLEQLDLYQDSAVWIIGGTYTDHLFGYANIRERIDRVIKTHQQAESERSRTLLTLLALVATVGFGGAKIYQEFFKPAERPMLSTAHGSPRPAPLLPNQPALSKEKLNSAQPSQAGTQKSPLP